MSDFQPTDDTIKTNPSLSNDTISKSLEISNNLGIDLDPVKNFTPNEDLNNKIEPAAKATRMIAGESDTTASAIKPDAEKLSGYEKLLRNSKIELDISDTRKKITNKVMLNVASDNGNALTEDDQLELDNLQIQMEDLQTERKSLGLSLGEEVATGDVVSVFNDMYEATKESPWATASAATGGFLLGGPAGAFMGFNIATSGGNAAYQLNAATAQTYQDLADATDDLGNPLDHNTKKGIAFTSGVIQSGLELGGDLALGVTTGVLGKGLISIGKKTGSKVATKLGAKLTVSELNDRLVQTAIKDIGFRKYIQNLAIKMAKGAPMEAITEVLQDTTGNFAKAIGQTWTQNGADTSKATDKFAEDFDVGQNIETAVRAGLTGSIATGVTNVTVNSAAPTIWGKAKSIYNKATGKNIELGAGDTVTVDESVTGPTRMTKEIQPVDESAAVPQDNTYHMVDGRPVGLDAHQATILGEILPTINAVRDTNLNIDPDAVTRLQEEHARNIGLDEVFMDKEIIDGWADTPDKRAYVADILGGDKGVHVDGQRVRLTRSQYFGMQKFGNVKFISDNTAVTSDGATIADIKKSVEEKKARNIPAANDIQASYSISPTSDLGLQSSIEDVTTTLKTKEDADAYIQRLADEANNLSVGSVDANQPNQERLTQIKEMKSRVEAIRNDLPDVDLTKIASEAVNNYGEFGIIPENIFNNMTPEEQVQFTTLVQETKNMLKNDLKMGVIKELDRTASMAERELNKQSEDAIIESIANNPDTKIVDWFLSDETMKIDPDSLTSNQKEIFSNNPLINKRNIYKKGGAKLSEVATAMDVTPDKLLEVLSISPSSQQAYRAQIIIEKARNSKESRRSATFNQGKLNKILDNKISFKRKLLEGILKIDPKAGLRLAYTILSQADKTKIEKSSINAQEITDNTRIGDLKPSTYLNASRRHQNRANEAMINSRDMEKAAAEVEKSIIADELFKAGRKTKERVEMVLNEIVRQSKDPDVRKNLESTGRYDQYQALLNMLGQGKLTPKQVDSVSELLIEWQEKGLEPESGLPSQMEAPLNVAGENNGQVDVNDLSLEQIETVKTYIDQLITDSNNIISNRLVNQQYFEQDIRIKAEQDAKNNPNFDGNKADTHAPGGEGYISNTSDFISGATDHVRGINEMVDWYEFGEKSIPRMILHMIKGVGEFAKQGGTFVRDKLWDSSVKMLTAEAGSDTIKRIKSYSGIRIEVPEFMGTQAVGADGKISKSNLISILLIKGSADGDQRLQKLGLDTDTVVKTIQLYLHKDDINLVKALYKVMKFLQPGITHVENTLKGYDNVEYVDGNSFKWYGETVEGGYVHFSYLNNDGGKSFDEFDRKLSQMVGDDKAYVNNEAARGYTKEGFKKSRTANVDKFIDLDFDNVVNKTLGNVVTNNTMLIPIVRSMQILNDKEVSKSLRTVMGKHGLQVFKNQTISAANGLVMDLSAHKSAILEGIGKTASGITRNYMTAVILGNLSSVMSNTISWSNVIFGNLDKKPLRSFKFPVALMSSLFIPGVHTKLRNNLEGFIPELTTTKENYQHNDLDNLSLFKNSKNSNVVIRKLSDFTRATSELWFEKVMGLFDSVGKTAYASMLLSEEISKIPTDKKAKMSKDDIKHYVSGKISDELNRYFPSRDSINIAVVQKHPIGKQLFIYFNDSRVQLNNIYFKRFRDVIRSVTFFPKRVAEKGIGYAVGKGVWDLGTNVAVLHLQSVIITSLIRSFRGEDEEGDRETNKPWYDRVFSILKKSLLDPFASAKAAGDMIPVVNSAIRYYESDGRYGYVTVPIFNWLKDSFDAGMGLYESKFKWAGMSDAERKAVAGFLTGPIPNLPMSPVKSYLLGDSTAFKTGASTITDAVGLLSSTAVKNISSVFNDTAEAMTEQLEEADDPDVEEAVSQYLMNLSEEQYDRLLTYPRGRAVLKRLLDLGEVAAIPPDAVNDIVFLESKGDPEAFNVHTGAAGIYQFLENTWNSYLKTDDNGEFVYPMAEGLSKAYPKGKVPDGEVDGRYDVKQASRMMYIMHNEIAKRLITNGIRPSRDSIYMGHHFGEGPAVKILKADDDQSLKDAYVSAFKKKSKGEAAFKAAVKNNPWVKADMTVNELKTALTGLLDTKGTETRLRWEEEMGQEFSIDNLP